MLRLRKHGLSKDLPPEWHDLSKRAGASIAESSSYLVGKLVAYERLLDDLFVADVDALSGAHLWADRFDNGLEDIFDLKDGSPRVLWAQ